MMLENFNPEEASETDGSGSDLDELDSDEEYLEPNEDMKLPDEDRKLRYLFEVLSMPAMVTLEELVIDFHLRDVYGDWEWTSNLKELEEAPERTVLPNVWNLDITVVDGIHLHRFFECMKLPKLSQITITCTHDHSETSCQLTGIAQWQQMIRESGHYCESLDSVLYRIDGGLYDDNKAAKWGCQWNKDTFEDAVCDLTEHIECVAKRDESNPCFADAICLYESSYRRSRRWDRQRVLDLSA